MCSLLQYFKTRAASSWIETSVDPSKAFGCSGNMFENTRLDRIAEPFDNAMLNRRPLPHFTCSVALIAFPCPGMKPFPPHARHLSENLSRYVAAFSISDFLWSSNHNAYAASCTKVLQNWKYKQTRFFRSGKLLDCERFMIGYPSYV